MKKKGEQHGLELPVQYLLAKISQAFTDGGLEVTQAGEKTSAELKIQRRVTNRQLALYKLKISIFCTY